MTGTFIDGDDWKGSFRHSIRQQRERVSTEFSKGNERKHNGFTLGSSLGGFFFPLGSSQFFFFFFLSPFLPFRAFTMIHNPVTGLTCIMVSIGGTAKCAIACDWPNS